MKTTDPATFSESRIQAALVKDNYSKAMIAMTGTLVNALIVVYILRHHIAHSILIAWLAITLLSLVVRALLVFKFHRTPDKWKNFSFWARAQVASLTVSGIIWGSTAIFLFPENSTVHQVFIAIVLAGMVAGAVGVFSAVPAAFAAFTIPALAPIIIRFALIGDDVHIAMSIMALLFGVLTGLTARRIHVSIRDLLVLKETFADQLEERTVELKSSEERFRTLADNMSQFCWMADPAGNISWFNKRWYEYTGTTLEEVKGWGWIKTQHPDHLEQVLANLQHSFESGSPWEDTMPLRGKDGRYRWFLSRAMPIRDDNGAIVRWFGTNTDITERRQVELDLQRTRDELEVKVCERTAQLERRNREIRELAHKTIKAMESDRKVLSRELHDSIGGFLAAIKYQLEARVEKISLSEAEETTCNLLQRVIGHVTNAIFETRRITKQMRPSVLADFGLAAAVEEYIRAYGQYPPLIKIACPIQLDDVGTVPGDVNTVLYSVLQEALNNVGKHSRATAVQIRLVRFRDTIDLCVRDNGSGFNYEEILNNRSALGGFGIHGMKERVEICNGAFSIDSAPGKGTTVTARIPLG